MRVEGRSPNWTRKVPLFEIQKRAVPAGRCASSWVSKGGPLLASSVECRVGLSKTFSRFVPPGEQDQGSPLMGTCLIQRNDTSEPAHEKKEFKKSGVYFPLKITVRTIPRFPHAVVKELLKLGERSPANR